jgi:hypothetical protein
MISMYFITKLHFNLVEVLYTIPKSPGFICVVLTPFIIIIIIKVGDNPVDPVGGHPVHLELHYNHGNHLSIQM